MIDRLVIFGALGDLAARLLLPAVAHTLAAGALPEDFRIVGTARDDEDDESFRRFILDALAEHAPEVDEEHRRAVAERSTYCRADATDAGQVAAAVAHDGPVACYLALPPAVFADAVDALAAAGLAEGSRLAVEKPFGEDLASARELNAKLHEHVPEDAIFRIDHFLGKQTVQNVLALRFANRMIEPVWNRSHIDRVEVVWDEDLTLEGRASYYDSAGALADMLQNHLLQLLALVAMEPPTTIDAHDLRDRKVDVLRAVRTLTADEVVEKTARARYGAGRVGDRDVPAYADEEGVDPDRDTETYAEIVLHVDNWRWAGVPFRLRSGKALAGNRKEVVVHFQPVPHTIHAGEEPEPNSLRLQFSPDRVTLGLTVNGPGAPFALTTTELDATLAPQELPAYGQLLLDLLDGDPLLSISAAGAEEAWRIMDPVRKAWDDGMVPLQEYPAGSDGPDDRPV
jgi:glucose-6-phosphate 1-dehydrogenase